jgi:hypothetical protein
VSIAGWLDYRLPKRSRVAFSSAGNQVNQDSRRSFAQDTQCARNPQTAVGGNTADRLFVKEGHIGRDRFRQQDRGLLASLQLLHANDRTAGILLRGDPRREGPEDIVVDIFAGSASTAHAVLASNAEDGGVRRCILVQIPEGCEEDGAAYKAGLRTIADIAKERIRRAGAKIKAESAITAPDLDVGFRVLKIDTSNMKDVYYAPDAIKQADLLAHLDNIREDRTPEDLLFQVLVDWGVDLALPIATESLAGKTVFFVDGNALAACFDTDINEDLVKELARRKPLRAVFRDSSYGSDSVKINVEQIFKLLSPSTEIKSL